MENPIMDKVMTIGSLVMVSILFMLTSLPIITIGASLSASYAVVWKMVCNGDNLHVVQSYFKAFKREFKQSTRLFLMAAGVGAVLACDLYFSFVTLDAFIGKLFLCFSGLLTLFYLLGLVFLFPLQARYANKTIAHIKNAYALGLRSFFTALFMLLMRVALYVIIIFYHYVIPAVTFVLILSGYGFIFYIDVLLVKKAAERFGAVSKKDETDEPGGVRKEA
jgi:uncharacterized membrane protein YesL